jgi:PPOX class probable F420-dependent enzyme
MTEREPIAELDEPYSDPGAQPMPWTLARSLLADAGVCWVTTVRPDGRPHVTPVVAVWMDGSVVFSTGPQERKARNLASNPHVVVTTGTNTFRGGVDVVVEGDAVRVTDDAALGRLAALFSEKYDDFFGFEAADGGFTHSSGGFAQVFEVTPTRAFAYGRGETYSATRFRFPAGVDSREGSSRRTS